MTEASTGKPKGVEPVPPPPDAAILKLEEAAYLLRISTRSVRRRIAEGHMKALNVLPGSALRVRREEVEDYLRRVEFTMRPATPAENPDRPPAPSTPRPPKEADDGHDPLRDGPRVKFKPSW